MATTSGELREILIEAITAVRSRQLDANDAKAIAMLAQQVSLSLQTEVNARREERAIESGHVELIGKLVLGDQRRDAK